MNKVRKFDLKALAASAVLFAILQGLMSAEVIGPFWELNLILICMNVILASSLNMINGFTGQFSIGHAGFLAVGAYMGAVMTVKLGFSFPLAIVAGTVAAGFLGFLIGLPTLRLDGDYLAIATLGLGEIIRICILNIEYIGGASGLMGIPRMTNFTITFWLMIAVLFFIKNFKNSAHGRACLAIRENEPTAGPAWPSAKTKSRRTPWASTPPNTKSWPLPWALPLQGLPGCCSPITSLSPIRRPSPSCVPLTS